MSSPIYVTVDPGLGGTGMAFWQKDFWGQKPYIPFFTHAITAPDKLDWLTRSDIIVEEFQKVLRPQEYVVTKVWVEYPGLHQTAAGHASASKGDIFKLMFLVGRFAQVCYTMRSEFVPLEVNEWKGTMSKEVVIRRISNRLGVSHDHFPNHVADAVGMGLHLQGVLNGTGLTRSADP